MDNGDTSLSHGTMRHSAFDGYVEFERRSDGRDHPTGGHYHHATTTTLLLAEDGEEEEGEVIPSMAGVNDAALDSFLGMKEKGDFLRMFHNLLVEEDRDNAREVAIVVGEEEDAASMYDVFVRI